MDIPMLDEVEWADVEHLLSNTIKNIKAYREQHGAPLGEAAAAVHSPALDRYFEITGFRETNHNAIWHHRRSIYGPPCSHCGKVLRTPVASKCFECGTPVPRTKL